MSLWDRAELDYGTYHLVVDGEGNFRPGYWWDSLPTEPKVQMWLPVRPPDAFVEPLAAYLAGSWPVHGPLFATSGVMLEREVAAALLVHRILQKLQELFPGARVSRADLLNSTRGRDVVLYVYKNGTRVGIAAFDGRRLDVYRAGEVVKRTPCIVTGSSFMERWEYMRKIHGTTGDYDYALWWNECAYLVRLKNGSTFATLFGDGVRRAELIYSADVEWPNFSYPGPRGVAIREEVRPVYVNVTTTVTRTVTATAVAATTVTVRETATETATVTETVTSVATATETVRVREVDWTAAAALAAAALAAGLAAGRLARRR